MCLRSHRVLQDPSEDVMKAHESPEKKVVVEGDDQTILHQRCMHGGHSG